MTTIDPPLRTCFLSHRGESDDAPENTAEAFALAMERDSDGMELDIRMTKDRQLVCVHDASLLRVAGVDLEVAAHCYSELRAAHPVPLLAEALELLRRGKFMQIELKGTDFDWAKLRRLIDRHLALGKQIGLSSFEIGTLETANAHFPDLTRVLLIDLEKSFGRFPAADKVADFCRQHHFSGVSCKADFRVDRTFVETLHAGALRVVAWGVDRDEKGLAMAAAGIDALTSNHAAALRAQARIRFAAPPQAPQSL